MSKKIIGYFLIVFIVMIMILTLIMIDSSLDYFSKLPEYEYIDTGEENIDSLTEEIALEKRDIHYGFYAIGTTYSLKQDERILTYVVDNTALHIGDIINKGDFIDSDELVPSLTAGQVYNISYTEDEYCILIYNFENISLKTNIDINNFNRLKDFNNIDIIFERNEFTATVTEINHTIINNKIELRIDFQDYDSINFNLIEDQNIYIKFEIGVLEDVLSIPVSLNLQNGDLVKIITNEGIKETNIVFGIQGFDYLQITNKELKAGDKIILEPQK